MLYRTAHTERRLSCQKVADHPAHVRKFLYREISEAADMRKRGKLPEVLLSAA